MSSRTTQTHKWSTFKGLIGIAPHGAVTFVSSLYPGSVSDEELHTEPAYRDDTKMTAVGLLSGEDFTSKQKRGWRLTVQSIITCVSGIVSLLKPGMAIMVDKGFLVDDCVPCKVYRPAYLSKREQMSAGEVRETVHCSAEGPCWASHPQGEATQAVWHSHPSFYYREHQPEIHCCLPPCKWPEWLISQSFGKGLKTR